SVLFAKKRVRNSFMRMSKYLVASILSATAAIFLINDLAAAADDAQEVYKLTLASYQPPRAAEAIATKQWAEEINEATDGRVQIKFRFLEALLPGAETLAGVSDGRADLGYIADAYYPRELPLTNVAGLPFVTNNPEAQGRAFEKLYTENEDFYQEWNSRNLHVLIWAPVPPNAMALKEPIDTLGDLKGKKIRAIGYSAAADKLAGMTPVAISQSEVYEALQRGVVDGTSGSSFDILIDRDYQEVAPHFVDPRTGNYAVTLTVINKDVWESMPDDIKDAINTVSEAYLDMYLGKLEERETQACDELIEAGGDVVYIDD